MPTSKPRGRASSPRSPPPSRRRNLKNSRKRGRRGRGTGERETGERGTRGTMGPIPISRRPLSSGRTGTRRVRWRRFWRVARRLRFFATRRRARRRGARASDSSTCSNARTRPRAPVRVPGGTRTVTYAWRSPRGSSCWRRSSANSTRRDAPRGDWTRRKPPEEPRRRRSDSPRTSSPRSKPPRGWKKRTRTSRRRTRVPTKVPSPIPTRVPTPARGGWRLRRRVARVARFANPSPRKRRTRWRR